MNDDKEYLEGIFTGLVFDSAINKNLQIFHDFKSILEEKSILSLQNNCKNLRVVFGPSFTIKTIVKKLDYF